MTTSLSHETHSQFIDQFFSSQFGIARNLQRGRRTVVISILFSSASGFSRILACWGRSVGNIYIPSLLLFVLCPQSSYIPLYLYLYHTCLFLSLPSYFACFSVESRGLRGKGREGGKRESKALLVVFWVRSVGRPRLGLPAFFSFLFWFVNREKKKKKKGRWICIYVHVYAVLCLCAHCVILFFDHTRLFCLQLTPLTPPNSRGYDLIISKEASKRASELSARAVFGWERRRGREEVLCRN